MSIGIIVEGQRHDVDIPSDHREINLAELLERAEWPLDTRCRHRGWCGGCAVHLVEGALEDLAGNRVSAPERNLPACRHRAVPGTAALIEIPRRSLAGSAAKVADAFKLGCPWELAPLSACGFYGLAVDVGTTTVVVMLVRLTDGAPIATHAAFNAQTRLGDNVITRIQLCQEDPAQVAVLQRAVLEETTAPLVAHCLNDAGLEPAAVGAAVVAGNTTMLHLVAGVDPTPMGSVPFTAPFLEHRTVAIGARLGLAEDLAVHLLPGVGAYLGSDVCAGVLAAGLDRGPRPALLVDVGTNGEMVLATAEGLSACATAAGPAFEGSGLSCGTRARPGAITHLAIDEGSLAVRLERLAGSEPVGLCGTAYLDLLAEGKRTGVLDARGRFTERLDGRVGPPVVNGGRTWSLTGDAADGIACSEGDVAALLQGKAAIAAGALTLLERDGLHPEDLQRVIIAGGFGLHIRVDSAVASGLLPGFPPDRIRAVGNSALGGAFLALVDRGFLPRLEETISGIEVVELNLDPDFQMRFMEQMSL